LASSGSNERCKAALASSTIGEIEAAFATLAHERPDALFVVADSFFTSRRVQITNLAARGRMAAAYSSRDFVEVGGLMSYCSEASCHSSGCKFRRQRRVQSMS
jgi:hypothetical protein